MVQEIFKILWRNQYEHRDKKSMIKESDMITRKAAHHSFP